MNIDTAQEIDGGRVSSLAQQQPGKLKGGGGWGWESNCTACWKDLGVWNTTRIRGQVLKQAGDRSDLDLLKFKMPFWIAATPITKTLHYSERVNTIQHV